MQQRKKSAIVACITLLTLIGIVVLLVGICGLPRSLNGEKGKHAFPLAGTDAITEEQAISYARQVLVMDNRDIANLHVEDIRGTAAATRPSKGNATVTVHYRHTVTGWDWYVTLERENGKVVGVSYHGL